MSSLYLRMRSSIRALGASADYLAAGLLLAGDGALGALAGAGVGLGALTVHRQVAAVTQTLVAADLDLAADVGGDLTAQVTLELVGALQVVAQLHQLGVGQGLHSDVRAQAGVGDGLGGAGPPHPEDVGECHLEPLVAGEVDTNESCHSFSLL